MAAIRCLFHDTEDSEGGSALALLLEAAGYLVETQIRRGSLHIAAAGEHPDIEISSESMSSMVHGLRERLRKYQ